MAVFRRALCFVLVSCFLLLTACQSARPDQIFAPVPDSSDISNISDSVSDSTVSIRDAVSDAYVLTSETVAQCAVEHLRKDVLRGKWFSAEVIDTFCGSPFEKDERYLCLVLAETSDISAVSVRWYQGGEDAEDIRAEKNRTYFFYIQASEDGVTWKSIYPADFDEKHTYARSGTGSEEETYSCKASGVNYVRIVGAGCQDLQNPANNKYFAVRNVSLQGKMNGGEGGFSEVVVRPYQLTMYNPSLPALLNAKRRVTVYFVRHGESDYTVSTNATAPLNETGVKQARAIAQYFTSKNISVDAVYSSPYQRCIETADPLSRAFNLPLEIDERLHERTIGTEVEVIPAGFAVAQWEDYEYKLEGGESLADVETRMAIGMTDIFYSVSTQEYDTVVVSTHAASLSVFLNCYQHYNVFSCSAGKQIYSRILSMQTPCVKCVFEGNKCLLMQFIDIGI